MANSQRRKGLRGEAEVAALWRKHRFDLRNLEGQGDLVVFARQPLHIEIKRQERLRTAWIDQAETEAPAGAIPVVAFRRSGGKWHAIIGLEDLARLLA